MSARTDIDKIAREARRQGWCVEAGERHWHFTPPRSKRAIGISKTPGSSAAVRSVVVRLRREGFVYQGR